MTPIKNRIAARCPIYGFRNMIPSRAMDYWVAEHVADKVSSKLKHFSKIKRILSIL